MIEALNIHVKGIVQGVGFRPFVYREAKHYLINGWVLNATDGVHIHAEAEGKLLDEFVIALSENAPAASKVTEIEMHEVPLEGFDSFEIRFSDEAEVEATTLVSPDLAMCFDCERELNDPNDRRYRYPFINCTNCGPRFTIIDELPYDRKKTSMKDFPMCPQCAKEYADPADRRFHAQPDACFECGPHIYWREANEDEDGFGEREWGMSREESDTVIARAIGALHAGKIVAIKGLGGFHLACDASNTEAVARLRRRKQREGKAFAVMAPSMEKVRAVCSVNDVEKELLLGSQRPIVLLKKLSRGPVEELAAGVVDDLPEVGVMLPYTPLQQLIVGDFGGFVVMTSGNIHDEPIVTDDDAAAARFAGIADAILGNDRAIRNRYDDSVLRVIEAGSAGPVVQMVRRARGFAPLPIALPAMPAAAPSEDGQAQDSAAAGAGDGTEAAAAPQAPTVFATGPEQKTTFAITREGEAFVSQHIGDVENAETFDAWLEAKSSYERLFELSPELVACDKHPEYLTSKWAADPAQKLPVFEVQHHHAHIAAVMAENGLAGPVCGFSFDGTGYGEDGAIWGGEVLLANLQTFERFANFAYFPLPGGAAAIKHPLRAAFGALWAYDLLGHPQAQAVMDNLGDDVEVFTQMIEAGINSPMTSSVGRLFDVASALLNVCREPKYEGEGAVLLEAAVKDVALLDSYTPDSERYAIEVVKNTALPNSTAKDTSVVVLDPAPMLRAMLDDMADLVPTEIIARRFHDAIVEAVLTISRLVRGAVGLDTFVLAGGVFMNRYLVEHTIAALEADGCTVAISRELPPNDGSISFGQAAVAIACAAADAC